MYLAAFLSRFFDISSWFLKGLAMSVEWFSLDDIELNEGSDDKLYCVSVDSSERQFLAGNIAVPTHNSEEGKAEDAMKGEANMIIGSIARLGRAAGVHLVIATQRPDAKLIPGETKANLGVRINCGTTNSTASSMILENAEGTKVKSNPRGRLYLQIYGKGDHGQGFFADQSWIDDYLESQGLNKDGSPISGRKKQSKLAHLTDMSEFDGTDLDSREGVDNSSIIERIREEEASEDFDDLLDDWDVEEDVDDIPERSVIPADEKMGRPEFTEGKDDPLAKWRRPEDDWDDELESLIEDNFSDVDFDDVPYDSAAFDADMSEDESSDDEN